MLVFWPGLSGKRKSQNFSSESELTVPFWRVSCNFWAVLLETPVSGSSGLKTGTLARTLLQRCSIKGRRSPGTFKLNALLMRKSRSILARAFERSLSIWSNQSLWSITSTCTFTKGEGIERERDRTRKHKKQRDFGRERERWRERERERKRRKIANAFIHIYICVHSHFACVLNCRRAFSVSGKVEALTFERRKGRIRLWDPIRMETHCQYLV